MLLVEGTTLAEDVNPLHVLRHAVEHRAHNLVEVGFGLCSRRHEVRAEEGHVIDVAGRHASGLHLGFGIETVTGLRLQGGRSTPAGSGDAFHQEFFQALLPRRAGRVHRHGDAAGLVGLARHAGLKLGGAVAIEDHVGMGIHPARQNCAPAQVDLLVRGRGLGGWADPGDGAVGVGDECGVGKRACLRHRAQL